MTQNVFCLFQLVEKPEFQSPILYKRRAFGVWNDKDSTFKFKLSAGVYTADVIFMGTTGIHEFHFTTDSAEASHVAWEHIDYNHTSDTFLLERAFTCHDKHPQVVQLPLTRVPGFTKFHNPTRPSHLVGGALVRCRAYSPSEIRSIRAVGLEQSPVYFSRRVRSMSRTPDREDRQGHVLNPDLQVAQVVLDLESIQGTGQCPLFRIKPRGPCLQKGGTLGLHPVEVDPDPDLLPNLLLTLLPDPHHYQRKSVLNQCGSSR